MADYNDFSIGFARALETLIHSDPVSVPHIKPGFSALSVGMHWPSMLSEDDNSVENFAEASSFFTMEFRADDVGETAGYALLRLLLESRIGAKPFRFHLLGHSFGCRVVLSTLEQLTKDANTLALAALTQFNVVLIQAAADSDSLAPGRLYENVLTKFPNIKILVTTSANDKALNTWYPAAQRLAHLFRDPIDAIGAAGLVGAPAPVAIQKITISPGDVPAPVGKFVVADLTPLHTARLANDPTVWNGFSGQHSDIYVDEIYQLLALFLGS
jgi:pimeloyl-ACP methyl ester carboxylesterase